MLHLRIAESHDAGRIAELFLQLGYANTGTELKERLAERFADSADRICVAEQGGRVEGVIVLNYILPFHAEGKWAMISALVVDQALRSSGVGAALLAHAEAHALAAGCSRVELSSNESRTRAHAFYLKRGFAEVRKRFVKRYA